MPFTIGERTYYFKADLVEMLQPAKIDVDHFLSRLRCRKVFQRLWSDKDLNEAYDRAGCLSEIDKEKPLGVRATAPKRKRQSSGKPLIGGYFDPERVGLGHD